MAIIFIQKTKIKKLNLQGPTIQHHVRTIKIPTFYLKDLIKRRKKRG